MSDDSSHSLVILTDDGEEVFPVTIGETTIGRTRSNHLTLRESSVSRSHCRIERTDDETRIYDAAPRNPTRLRRAGDDLTKNANGKVLRDASFEEICSGAQCFLHEEISHVANEFLEHWDAAIDKGPYQ